jgi:hypothetical protein
MVIFLDSKGAWPLSHCRPNFLCEPCNVLGARAGIIALRAGLRGALFVLAKVRQLIFFWQLGVVLLVLQVVHQFIGILNVIKKLWRAIAAERHGAAMLLSGWLNYINLRPNIAD